MPWGRKLHILVILSSFYFRFKCILVLLARHCSGELGCSATALIWKVLKRRPFLSKEITQDTNIPDSVLLSLFLSSNYKWVAQHDKTNNMACLPSKDADQTGHPPSLIRVFSMHSLGSQSPNTSSCRQRSLWSDWADTRLIWVFAGRTGHFVGFVMQQFISITLFTPSTRSAILYIWNNPELAHQSPWARKYNLHYDEVWGDFLGPPHMHLTQYAVKINRISFEKEILWKQGNHTSNRLRFIELFLVTCQYSC